ncbi:AmmeMemoRadiSam system protein B, partial [Candidatus Dependentiae bacterium]|nr:AmmeMemoRadiSam system protein B [Candidatus Dependentiae bacterium]
IKKILIVPLSLMLTAGCLKKTQIITPTPSAPIAQPIQSQSQPQSQAITITKNAHLDANWYTKNVDDLNQEMDEYLELAIKKCYVEADSDAIQALVVPHAGLYYSGFCAATTYQTLLSNKNLLSENIKNNKINHVIILAPDHSGMNFGIVLPHYTEYQTPLGNIAVNTTAVSALQNLKFAKINDATHNTEHSIEMQLPWLKKTISKFTITPIIIGNIDQHDTNALISELKKIITDSTLLVVTSDFTHHGAQYRYQIFEDNIINYLRALDSTVLEALLKKDLNSFNEIVEQTQDTICGYNPLMILLTLLQDNKFNNTEGRLCSYYTSAHVAQARPNQSSINVAELIGDLPDEAAKTSVSYAGIVYSNQRVDDLLQENRLTGFEKQSLTSMARETIDNELSQEDRLPPQLLWPITTPRLNLPYGIFVTLKDKNDQLRGCIGRITTLKPLYQTTQDMAMAAAFKDERFAPLSKMELDSTKVHITILNKPERIFALSNIVLGKHGIILNKYKEDGTLLTSSVFLPQVPISMQWDLATTLNELSRKAGLAADGWQDNCELQIFDGYEIKEEE